MAAPRKKWATTTLVGGPRRRAASEVDAYRYAREVAGQYANGVLRGDIRTITVWVDEGLGRGWERYETLDLAELAAPSGTETP